MPLARKHQISVTDTPYYHCYSRCVRRTFLCGIDPATGINYDHRKQWIVDRISFLSHVFSIEVCAYAVMSNHIHLVLKIDTVTPKTWSEDDIIQHWTQLYSGDNFMKRYFKGELTAKPEIQKAQQTIETWRKRLSSLSWFMGKLNEFIARKANEEDDVTGHFWEGRFKSQALLNEQALIGAMVYVDLNPIRANMADNLEESDYTSIQQRIREHFPKAIPQTRITKKSSSKSKTTAPPVKLSEFIGGSNKYHGVPFNFRDYLELADWTGRISRPDKVGHISSKEPSIIKKLGIDSETWLNTLIGFKHHFKYFVGPEQALNTICKKQKKKWLSDTKPCRQLFH